MQLLKSRHPVVWMTVQVVSSSGEREKIGFGV